MRQSNRPPLFAVEATRRRAPRPPRVSAWLIVAVLALAGVIGAAAYSLWVVWPLTDRGAGAIPPADQPVLSSPVPAAGEPSPAAALAPLRAAGASTAKVPGVSLRAGVVLQPQSGRVLWMFHPHRAQAVASLTKMVTALVATRLHGTRGRFTVTPAMTTAPGQTLGLADGEKVSARDMLAAALVASDNDAADALAVHSAGSVSRFVARMNRWASAAALSDSRFSNPSGIFDAGNRSSAWDMADVARRVLANPRLARLVASKSYAADGGLDLVNTNKLLWSYAGTRGVKTGFTTASGRCLVAAATVRHRTLIAVVLGAQGSEFAAASRLLDWGFRRL